MKYRHVNAVVLAIMVLAALAAALIASRVSIVLAIAAAFAVPATLVSLAHNRNPFTVWAHKRDEARKRDDRFAFIGVHEMEAGLLFADIRGFTAWSEQHAPDAVAAELTRFYAVASRVLSRDDAFVEFVGDQVMALYLPSFPSLRERMPEVMVTAARRLIAELKDPKYEIALPIGVGLHMGVASVGNVGKGQIKDFTAVGDVVNTAARLQSCAKAGQIVLSRQIHEQARSSCTGASSITLSVKGKSEPLEAYVIDE